MPEPLEAVEREVARTAELVLRAGALAERMRGAEPTPTLSGNVRRLELAVEAGRAALLRVALTG